MLQTWNLVGETDQFGENAHQMLHNISYNRPNHSDRFIEHQIQNLHRWENLETTHTHTNPDFFFISGVSELCLTVGCVKSASDLFNNINTTANPCENFYNFACGNYIENSKIPQDKTFVNTFTLITTVLRQQLKNTLEETPKDSESNAVQTAKLYYRACMNKSKGCK